MKYFLLIFFSYSLLFAVTGHDLSNRIAIDGYSLDFTVDEYILGDTLSNCVDASLEPNNDSKWGNYNDVRQIKVTWDDSYLYVAVDACSWGNNVMLFIDVYDDYGIEDMSELNTWKRSFKFYNTNPDFFLATWDTNTDPQFWKIREGASTLADEESIEDFSSLNTGKLDRAMEAKIPWTTLYPEDSSQRTMQNYPAIKVLAVITSGSDYKSGPDVAPDNLAGMPSNADQSVILDNYAKIVIDEDGDGLPDIGIEPLNRISFFKRPPFNPVPLKILSVDFPNGKTFSPYREDITFSLTSNRVSIFYVQIFDMHGKYISNAEKVADQSWKWNGYDKSGKMVPFGVYILRFISDSNEVSHKEAVVVIK